MKCLVADDDPLVCATVEEYLSRIDDVEFCVHANDGLTALNLLTTGGFDLVFLDLQMPGLDGKSLLQALPRSIPVVIVSASEDFGAQSYEFDVVDYLVKPIGFARFFQAVQKVRDRRNRTGIAGPKSNEVFVKEGTRILKVALDTVLYIKAEASYVEFVTDTKSFLSLMSMKKLEELLPADFVRVHRSFIVPKSRITKIEDGQVVVGQHRIPISQSYRDELMRRLNILG